MARIRFIFASVILTACGSDGATGGSTNPTMSGQWEVRTTPGQPSTYDGILVAMTLSESSNGAIAGAGTYQNGATGLTLSGSHAHPNVTLSAAGACSNGHA